MRCGKCGRENTLDGIVGRNEVCSSCGADLRTCINCGHYDPGSTTLPGTPGRSGSWTRKKDFCDFFQLISRQGRGKRGQPNPTPGAG